jgi:predicted TIM-barrel enzyme
LSNLYRIIQFLYHSQKYQNHFVRVEGFVFAHVADEGIIDGCAGEILRYRRQIGADDVLVLTDVKKKHSSHALTADMDIAETARAAEFFLSDGVIVTGLATGILVMARISRWS